RRHECQLRHRVNRHHCRHSLAHRSRPSEQETRPRRTCPRSDKLRSGRSNEEGV
ncbi:hypothetical protein MMC31_000766, partial [Peltigera leucophlebia]|nr:hypothetical protein [Peltigera leucophlebia]